MKNYAFYSLHLGAVVFRLGLPHLSTGRLPKRVAHPKKERLVIQTQKARDTVTLGAGCFWCTQAVFEALKGVKSVVSGFSGGRVKNPSYREVLSGKTGHAEVANIVYDPTVISFTELLDVFWQLHDPTTVNRQGADVGTQYRSAIFYRDAVQKRCAEESLRKAQKHLDKPIVTEIVPFEAFYPAEAEHQAYYRLHSQAPYCQAVIRPKLTKVAKRYKAYVKDQ